MASFARLCRVCTYVMGGDVVECGVMESGAVGCGVMGSDAREYDVMESGTVECDVYAK